LILRRRTAAYTCDLIPPPSPGGGEDQFFATAPHDTDGDSGGGEDVAVPRYVRGPVAKAKEER
jgi:hypothetical protein